MEIITTMVTSSNEFRALEQNRTWTVTQWAVIGFTKPSIIKYMRQYKFRRLKLVTKSYTQIQGVDYIFNNYAVDN